MSSDKEIVPVQEITSDDTWRSICDRIVEELHEEDLPDQVIQATELILAGYPLYKVAKQCHVSTSTVRRWMTTYPTMAAAIANGHALLSKWRMGRLEQQFLAAVEKSQEVLGLSLNGNNPETGESVDPKVLTVVAAQARYIIGLFAGQKIDVTVTHEAGDSLFKAKKDALDYIVEQLQQQRDNSDAEPIEAVFRVIDPKMDNEGPMLDEDGQPFHGELGKLDKNDDGMLCHICGKRYKALATHILKTHAIGTHEYELIFMLEEGSLKQEEVNYDTTEI